MHAGPVSGLNRKASGTATAKADGIHRNPGPEKPIDDGQLRTLMADDLIAQAEVFRHQAAQARERSPLYANLCEHFAEDPRVADIVESPPRWDAPLRLLSGLHYLVLTGSASWDSIDQALVRHRDFLRGFVSTHRVQ